ncbi:LacI family transcriptional regulator [Paenibacillus sp. FSL H8-0548]|uniref:substrate-binding domain-containing protein n=1 Tax=Paenibacillus sp. FSL H8-0548 TaxID=1920422 RepID=UPI00096BF0FB|nr:substrate-binding domain-containing protein [Paenibacillus sp. FSL H8-0548]OMF37003.1 LacI family transcriptional regulator [Paenibacillus sp. FSL H8-0548]
MSNRKWNIGIAILFIIFACLLASFLQSTINIRTLLQPAHSDPGTESEATTKHIVLISQELDNPYWRSIEEGAIEAALKYGMQLEYVGPLRINSSEQSQLLEKAIAAKADAVLVQGINDPKYIALIDEAIEEGIAVLTIDTDEQGSRRLSYVGTNNFDAGVAMGELVAKAARNRGDVAVLIGNEQSPNQQLRLAGFRSVLSQLPEMTLVDVRSSNISRLQAAGETEKLLIQNPQINFMVGLSALDGIGISEAAQRLRRSGLQIFAFDALEETVERVRSGAIHSTIVQQPYDMGYAAISQLNDYFLGKQLPEHFFTKVTLLGSDELKRSMGDADS